MNNADNSHQRFQNHDDQEQPAGEQPAQRFWRPWGMDNIIVHQEDQENEQPDLQLGSMSEHSDLEASRSNLSLNQTGGGGPEITNKKFIITEESSSNMRRYRMTNRKFLIRILEPPASSEQLDVISWLESAVRDIHEHLVSISDDSNDRVSKVNNFPRVWRGYHFDLSKIFFRMIYGD